MHNCGLLVLSNVLKKATLRPLLSEASKFVSNRLILVIPKATPLLDSWKKAVFLCYSTASEVCPLLDVHLMLPNVKLTNRPQVSLDVVFTCDKHLEDAFHLARTLDPQFDKDVIFTEPEPSDIPNDTEPGTVTINSNSTTQDPPPYTHVCLGGTFDRLHNGHKILLSTGALITSQRLMIGITADTMVQGKQLAPLILSYEKRSKDVQSFMSTIGFPSSQLELVKLEDPFGPPATCSEFQCIVASDETASSCTRLNAARQENGLQPLNIEPVPFVLDTLSRPFEYPSSIDDGKLSSSTNRFSLLGSQLRPVKVKVNPLNLPSESARPYVIGLAGPSGAGKTALARRLGDLNAAVHVVDCDRLGHEAYRPGTPCHVKLLKHFGQDAIALPDPPHAIDRARLGKLVFADAQRLTELNEIVWPEIERQVRDELAILRADSSGLRPIVLLDAAVLFQAKWDQWCDEIWVAIIPRDEAHRRVCERPNSDPKVITDRLARQAATIAQTTGGLDWWNCGQVDSGYGPVGRAHVVLSTQWEPECSQKQVETAFRALLQRLPPTHSD